MTQHAYGDLIRNVDIPAEFLLHMALSQEGDNYEGVRVAPRPTALGDASRCI